jgi:hypothetical protein
MDICASTKAHLVAMPDFLGDLRAAVNRNGHKPGGNGHQDPAPAGRQVQVWLDELDCAAEAGDVEAVREKVRLIREGLGEKQIER